MGPYRISAAIICKNNEKVIERCLDSIRPYVDEIVVCDTGSTDSTISIVKPMEDVFLYTDFKWCNDFSKARNHCNSKCTGDWIFSIDSDEVFTMGPGDFETFHDRIEADGPLAYRIRKYSGGLVYCLPRLYKNCSEVKWVNPFHNVLSVTGQKGNMLNASITEKKNKIELSYSDRQDRQKELIKTFKDRIKQSPKDERSMFYLARTYRDNHMVQDSIDWFEKYLEIAWWKDEIYCAWIGLGRQQQFIDTPFAIRSFLKAYEVDPDRNEAQCEIMKIYLKEGLYKQVGFYYEVCREGLPPDDKLFLERATYAYLPRYLYAQMLYNTGDLSGALRHGKLCMREYGGANAKGLVQKWRTEWKQTSTLKVNLSTKKDTDILPKKAGQ